MDQELRVTDESAQHFDLPHGEIRTLEDLEHNVSWYKIVTSPYFPVGQLIVADRTIFCTPTNDLVWERTWRTFLQSERNKAKRHLQEVVGYTRIRFGLPPA